MRTKYILSMTILWCLIVFAVVAAPVQSQVTVQYVSPAQNAVGVPTTSEVEVFFDGDLDPADINGETIIVQGLNSGLVQGNVTYNPIINLATFEPLVPLRKGETYFVSVSYLTGATCFSWMFSVESVGAQRFAAVEPYDASVIPIEVLGANLNGDGPFDLAISSGYKGHYASVLFGEGDASYSTAQTFQVGRWPFDIGSADFDHDGDMDLVTSNTDSISVMTNDGTGTFSGPMQYFTGNNGDAVVVGDFLGDGYLDIASVGGTTVSVFMNDQGYFVPSPVTTALDNSAVDIVAGDMNGDGAMDLVTANNYAGSVTYVENYYCGYVLFYENGEFPVHGRPLELTLGDFDGDGDLDIATANTVTNDITVLLNSGTGSFSPGTNYPFGEFPYGLTAADVDGDGDVDLTASRHIAGELVVLENDGTGSFTIPRAYPVAYAAEDVAVLDLDDDGDLDMAVADVNSHEVFPVLQYICGDANNSGSINVADINYLVNYIFRGGPPPRPLEAGDCNGDCTINVGDINYLVNFVFKGGPPPVCYCEGGGAASPVADNVSGSVPQTFMLYEAYPNPFNPTTTISYDLPFPSEVRLDVFNVAGQRVTSLVNEYQTAGHKSVVWDGRSDAGNAVASGVYFYRLTAEGYRESKKMVLLK
jgi:hypothetical protein